MKNSQNIITNSIRHEYGKLEGTIEKEKLIVGKPSRESCSNPYVKYLEEDTNCKERLHIDGFRNNQK